MYDDFNLYFVFVVLKTGSGKTYTMGTNYNGEDNAGGIIPQVMQTIYSRVESMRGSTEFLIRVSFIEVNLVEYYIVHCIDDCAI